MAPGWLRSLSLNPFFLTDVLVQGLVLGAIYALMAIGVTLIVSVMNLSNFTHGEFYMIGGYALYYATLFLGLPSIACLPISILLGALVGFVVQRLLLEPFYSKKFERRYEMMMMTTFVLSILLINVAKEVESRLMSPPPFIGSYLEIGAMRIGSDRLFAFFIGVSTLMLLYYLLHRTATGRSWRATAQNPNAAVVCGIDIKKVRYQAYSVGAALAALSGALLSPVFGIRPDMGAHPLTISFSVVVIGGLGSVRGSFIAAIVIGVIQSFISALVGSVYADAAMYIVLLITLVVRPSGLFG